MINSAISSHVDDLIHLIRQIYGEGFVPLHRPIFEGNERQYLVECVDSNFVSSVGVRVKRFEEQCEQFTGIKNCISTVNGTAALHVALKISGVEAGHEVITQALTFVATCNAILYCGAQPIFIDVDKDTMGLSPTALEKWLSENVEMRNGKAYNRTTGRRISACVPMHTFGHPLRIREVVDVCTRFGIIVIEDAAEALGSYIGEQHVGGFGELATLSFNGNKVITTGGGGMILTNSQSLAHRAAHVTTTAKVPHEFEFVHDEVGFNYRLPAINAALGCAQMEMLQTILNKKIHVAGLYDNFCSQHGINFFKGMKGTRPNFWLNVIFANSKSERDNLLKYMNSRDIMARPIWRLINSLKMYKNCQTDELVNSKWLEDRVINIPSSATISIL